MDIDPFAFAADRPTLQEIARKTLHIDGIPLEESTISNALKMAGIDPSNEQERERFRRLVVANMHTRAADEIGKLGNHYKQAAEELGPDADPDEIVCEARHRFYEANPNKFEQEMNEWFEAE